MEIQAPYLPQNFKIRLDFIITIMLILGIETSCDETAAAVLKSDSAGRADILSSIIFSQVKIHAKTGGVVPEVAARAHVGKIIPVVLEALKKARTKLAGVDALAVTAGPGLITSLMVGVDTAKTLAAALQKPIVAVNHIEAHAYSSLLPQKTTNYKLQATSLLFPAIALVVSGGHTDLILIRDWLKHKKIGQTLDDAAGECFDKTAKILGLGYPGGPAISKLAESGNPNAIKFPRPMITSDDFNFSFSGLKTAVLYYARDHRISPPLPLRERMSRVSRETGEGVTKADTAASAQQAIVDVLVAKTIAAAKKYSAKTVLLGGGVAANQLLREELIVKCQLLNVKFFAAAKNLCTDNAAMIAFAGFLHARKKDFTPWQKIKADSGWEIK